MDLAELDQGFDANPATRQNPGVSVTFFYRTCKDAVASAEQGRPIFKDREFMRIMVAGDRENIIERLVTPPDRVRYAARYQQFKSSAEQVTSGFPLSEWPGVLRSQVEELKYFNIRTVEELASVSDANGQKFPMFISLREKARKYLEQLEKNAPLEKIQEELKARDTKIALLEQNMAALIEEAKARKAEEDDE